MGWLAEQWCSRSLLHSDAVYGEEAGRRQAMELEWELGCWREGGRREVGRREGRWWGGPCRWRVGEASWKLALPGGSAWYFSSNRVAANSALRNTSCHPCGSCGIAVANQRRAFPATAPHVVPALEIALCLSSCFVGPKPNLTIDHSLACHECTFCFVSFPPWRLTLSMAGLHMDCCDSRTYGEDVVLLSRRFMGWWLK